MSSLSRVLIIIIRRFAIRPGPDDDDGVVRYSFLPKNVVAFAYNETRTLEIQQYNNRIYHFYGSVIVSGTKHDTKG